MERHEYFPEGFTAASMSPTPLMRTMAGFDFNSILLARIQGNFRVSIEKRGTNEPIESPKSIGRFSLTSERQGLRNRDLYA